MKSFSCFGKKLQHICSCSCFKLASFCRSTCFLLSYFYRYALLRINPLCIQLFYFISVSFLGFWILKSSKPRTDPSFRPRNLDLFFTSVSASTVSSMSTVEMEAFSNTQLIVLTILMFIGGEVFTSMVGLHLARWFKHRSSLLKKEKRIDSTTSNLGPPCLSNFPHDHIELGIVLRSIPDSEISKSEGDIHHDNQIELLDREFLRSNSIKFLGFLVLGYLVIIHVVGVAFVLVYLTVIPSARVVLKNKGLKIFTFSLFTTVSTFSSCGFVPTNENMIGFSKNSGLLLILTPQILLGNSLFPSCLRFFIWVLGKFCKKRESKYLLTKNTREIGYHHLLPGLHSSLLVVSVLGFILIQFILFCSMEWNSQGLNGLTSYQKVVGGLFQTVNSRHTGETIVDLSTIAPAVLVLFVVMMYLPPYTSFQPIKDDEQCCPREFDIKKRRGKFVENLIFSQLSYLVIFIILVCITEREKMKEDPLNFNVLNIVVEVISAYGNVGFSTGYSCERQLKSDGSCKDKWFGFSGKWSDEGKLLLILVMFFGRLKKFNMDGGRAWKLL